MYDVSVAMRKLTQIVYFYLNLKNDMFFKPKIMSRQIKRKDYKNPPIFLQG